MGVTAILRSGFFLHQVLGFDPYLVAEKMKPAEEVLRMSGVPGLPQCHYLWSVFLDQVDLLSDQEATEALSHLLSVENVRLGLDGVRQSDVTEGQIHLPGVGLPDAKSIKAEAKAKQEHLSQCRRLVGMMRVQKRWAYWLRALFRHDWPTERIPQIHFQDANGDALKMVRHVVHVFEQYGYTLDALDALDALASLILYGCGALAELPARIPPEVWQQGQEALDFPLLLSQPADYLGTLAAESGTGGKGTASSPRLWRWSSSWLRQPSSTRVRRGREQGRQNPGRPRAPGIPAWAPGGFSWWPAIAA